MKLRSVRVCTMHDINSELRFQGRFHGVKVDRTLAGLRHQLHSRPIMNRLDRTLKIPGHSAKQFRDLAEQDVILDRLFEIGCWWRNLFPSGYKPLEFGGDAGQNKNRDTRE